jgi:hypothetical protein
MTSAASAATITNRGDKEVKLTITEGSSRQDEGSESVSVEGGFLYYDSPENEGAPPAGSTSGHGDQR